MEVRAVLEEAVADCPRRLSNRAREKAKIRDKVDRIVPLSRTGERAGELRKASEAVVLTCNL
jgi:hypothetical protein